MRAMGKLLQFPVREKTQPYTTVQVLADEYCKYIRREREMKRLQKAILTLGLVLLAGSLSWGQGFQAVTYGVAPAAGTCGAGPCLGIDVTNNVLYHAGTSGAWVRSDRGSGTGTADGYMFEGPSSCVLTQTGGTAVASGLTNIGNVSVFVSQTSTAASTVTVICAVNIETRLTAGQSAILNSVQLRYASSVGNIATCNAPTVGTQTTPAPGIGETAAAVALVSAGGSLTVNPVIASCNVTAVTAGQMYSEAITFGTPIVMGTTQQVIYVTQTFVGPAANFTFYVAGLDVFYTIPGPV